jgi:hypothetical protein
MPPHLFIDIRARFWYKDKLRTSGRSRVIAGIRFWLAPLSGLYWFCNVDPQPRLAVHMPPPLKQPRSPNLALAYAPNKPQASQAGLRRRTDKLRMTAQFVIIGAGRAPMQPQHCAMKMGRLRSGEPRNSLGDAVDPVDKFR